MQGDELSLLQEVYRRVLPNVVHISELEKLIKEASDLDDIRSVIEWFKRRISDTPDIVRKTDYRILLNELQRELDRQQKSK